VNERDGEHRQQQAGELDEDVTTTVNHGELLRERLTMLAQRPGAAGRVGATPGVDRTTPVGVISLRFA
jgi:hypothetical protein